MEGMRGMGEWGNEIVDGWRESFCERRIGEQIEAWMRVKELVYGEGVLYRREGRVSGV